MEAFMKQYASTDMQSCFDSLFNEIFYLESIIKLTKESCLEREITASYYNLPKLEQTGLSEERNHYINMLSIAQEKLLNLKKINSELEKGCALL